MVGIIKTTSRKVQHYPSYYMFQINVAIDFYLRTDNQIKNNFYSCLRKIISSLTKERISIDQSIKDLLLLFIIFNL